MSKTHNRKDAPADENYLDDMAEYQNNQFNPGYYVGTGKVPFSLKFSGGSTLTGVLMVVAAVVATAVYGFIIKCVLFDGEPFASPSSVLSTLAIFVMYLLLMLILIRLAIRFLRKGNRGNHRKK